MSNIRLFHPENITENTTGLLSKEHTHYVVNVMRLKRGSNLNFLLNSHQQIIILKFHQDYLKNLLVLSL